MNVCSTSGLIPPAEGTPDRCPTRFEYFIKGNLPKNDPGRTSVLIDKATGDIAKEGQVDNTEPQSKLVVTDPTGDKYCLDCPHPELSPTPSPGSVQAIQIPNPAPTIVQALNDLAERWKQNIEKLRSRFSKKKD
jgi:hypothetical protein